MHELFEEIEAYDPKWRQRYPTVRAAAQAAGCPELYTKWLLTPAGRTYADHIASLPDAYGAAQRDRDSRAIVELDELPTDESQEDEDE